MHTTCFHRVARIIRRGISFPGLVFLFVFVVNGAFAQSYKTLREQADKNYTDKNYEAAAQLYEQAFSADNTIYRADNLYDAACSYALAGQKEKALDCLEKAIGSGWTKFDKAQADNDLQTLHDDARWLQLPAKIQQQKDAGKPIYYWGMYFGILFILFLYNFFLFLSLKEVSLLYYCTILFLYAQFEAIRSPAFGFYAEDIFVWLPRFHSIHDPANFFICITMVFQLLFARSFLGLKQDEPRLNRITLIFTWYFAAAAIIVLFINSYPLRPFIYATALAGLLFSFVAGVYCWRLRIRPARFFVVANIVYIIGISIVILNSLQVLNVQFTIGVFRPDNLGQIVFFSLLSFAIGDKINILKREKEEAQEKALEVLEEKVKERTNEVVQQKQVIEEKQKELIESIHYARSLQDAILPPAEFIREYLPQHFIFYKPKDVVAGDFFWAEKAGELFYIAAADSTGHGVPGAMVSIVCSTSLSRAIKEFKLVKTGEILDKARELVIETFEKSERDVKDGMDISLLCLDFKNKKAWWSGANNVLWYVQDGELKEVKADKQPIGKTEIPKPFATREIDCSRRTVFYLFTDGFADQFGGPKGKKFMYRQLSALLFQNAEKDFREQAVILEQSFENWKGSLEQVDDVCIIGLGVS